MNSRLIHIPLGGILHHLLDAKDGYQATRSWRGMTAKRSTAVLEVSGVQWATSKNVAEAVLSRRPGVLECRGEPRGADCHRHL